MIVYYICGNQNSNPRTTILVYNVYITHKHMKMIEQIFLKRYI